MASKKDDKKGDTTGDDAESEKKSGKGKFIIIGVVVAALAAGAYVVGTKSSAPAASDGSTTTTTTVPLIGGCVKKPEEGAPKTIVPLPELSINLADGHYLRAAISLGLCADVVLATPEEFKSAPAEDLVVSSLTGLDMAELATTEGREKAKDSLSDKITAMYRGEVYEIYFVEFVMQ